MANYFTTLQTFRRPSNSWRLGSQSGFSTIAIALGLTAICLGVAIAQPAKNLLRQRQQIIKVAAEDTLPLFLPEVRYVRLVTLGFDRLASDVIWFNTLNYFGKQYERHGELQWLSHMCILVTELNKDARHVFEFCSTLLSWIAKDPLASSNLLTKAIETDPNYWRYYYLRGFNYYYFMNQPNAAQADFSKAATQANAPPFISSLASRLMVASNQPSVAVEFLREMVNQSRDPIARQALTEKLKLAQISNDISILEQLTAKYQQRFGQQVTSIEQLIDAKLLPSYPLDPFGKKYWIEPRSGAIKTRSGKRGLEFYGKTAETGLASKIDGWRPQQ